MQITLPKDIAFEFPLWRLLSRQNETDAFSLNPLINPYLIIFWWIVQRW